MDRCDQCGFSYAEHAPPGLLTELEAVAGQHRDRLGTVGPDRSVLSRRPAPETWSALEYVGHVRDVFLTQRERMLLALVEDNPSFAPMYRDRRVDLARYNQMPPEQLGPQLTVAASLFTWVCAGLTSDQWNRPCVYNFPAPSSRTILWVAQHTLHEGVHHLADVDRGLRAIIG